MRKEKIDNKYMIQRCIDIKSTSNNLYFHIVNILKTLK